MGYNLVIKGVYSGYNPLILTFDPNFLGHPSRVFVTPQIVAMGFESDHSLWQGRNRALHHLRFLFSPTSGVSWKHVGWAILFWSKNILHLALLKATKKMWWFFCLGRFLSLFRRSKKMAFKMMAGINLSKEDRKNDGPWRSNKKICRSQKKKITPLNFREAVRRTQPLRHPRSNPLLQPSVLPLQMAIRLGNPPNDSWYIPKN